MSAVESKVVNPTTAVNAPLKVFVSSATSSTGAAAIDHLLKSSQSVIIRAGARDLSKANKRFPNVDSKRLSFAALEVKQQSSQSQLQSQSVPTLTGDSTKDGLELKGWDTLILIPPQEFHDRLGVVKAYVNAAKAANIKHIIFVSAPAASKPHLILGKNLHASEKIVRESGIAFTILSAVFFYENHFGNASTIKSQNVWYNPAKSSIAAPQLSVSDIGEAAAKVALSFSSSQQQSSIHKNKVYTIVGDVRTWDEVAVAYSQVLGRTIKYVSVNDESAIAAMKAFMPENMAKGIVELNRDFESAKLGTYSTVELKQLLGREPQSFQDWIRINKAAFQ